MRVALLIQYDGSNYHGWQIQTDPQTVQGIIEGALKIVFQQTIGIIGSGRTDSGVHALGQVAHFDILGTSIPSANIWMALNQHLPEDIRIIASQKVADDFHSRFSANQREYRYRISTSQNVLNRNSRWHMRFPIEPEKLRASSKVILGSHDFSSFCYAGTETENMVCEIKKANWIQENQGSLSFYISGDRFLHHMVRMLVGSMIEVARSKWELEKFNNLLNHPHRQAQVVTAPPRGLTLIKVSYPDHLQPDWIMEQQNLASPTRTG
ncbi:tRNA pseudouridine(38-40) synthase TruA [bacterium]|nr:tRNA pseudouridine(38-40) synthase TruA [bacterium]